MKEKQTAAQQNAQLWRLINKQRHLIMGLNNDLAKAAEDRERYSKRYKELANVIKLPPAQPIQTLRRNSMSMNSSPARSEEDLPIQRHSILAPKVGNRRSASVGADGKTSLKEIQEMGRTATESITSSSNASPAFSSEGKTRTTPDSEGSYEGFDSRRNTIVQSSYKPISPIAPLEIKKLVPMLPKVQVHSEPNSIPPPIPGQQDSTASPSSFTARRSMATVKPISNSPISGIPDGDAVNSPFRKGPPARLNLQQKAGAPKIVQSAQPPRRQNASDHSDSDSDSDLGIDERPAFERGRKKTREEDDREREYIIAKQEESRSQSNLDKLPKSGSKSGTPLPTPDITTTMTRSPTIHAFSPSGSPAMPTSFSPHASLDGMLSGKSTASQSTTLTAPPLSPGLPRSPRPGDRPQNAPQPRAPHETQMISPPPSIRGSYIPASLSSPSIQKQLNHQQIMPQTPVSISSPKLEKFDTASITSSQNPQALNSPGLPSPRPTITIDSPKMASPKTTQSSREPPKSPLMSAIQGFVKSTVKETVKSPVNESLKRIPSDNSSLISTNAGVYRGLVSDMYPDMLLPPNALPSISVKVTSSRLRPSRNSMLSLKSVEEEPVFTLGITARSNMKQLWRVEKAILALPHLDQQLKAVCPFDVRLPERNLFTGHAPSKIDARREALEKYFEDVLDTPMNEKAGLIICHFLSTQAILAEDHDGGMKSSATTEGQHPVQIGADGKLVKEGFLTKRGKNFGGWKARYFVLDGPLLRYYESPGGPLLGQIKLANAQIGRQSAQSSAANHSPSRAGEENEKEFRHAFLILEPKKKDSTSMLRHVLCAENDLERDEWVEALLQYIGQPNLEVQPKTPRKILTSMMRSKDDSSVASSSREDLNILQGVNYDDTVAGQPVRTGPSTENVMVSPLLGGFQHPPPSAGLSNRGISGPSGGAVIHDVLAWGNKPPESPKARDKEKKRGLWGFRDRSDNNTSSSVISTQPPKTLLPFGSKAIFGIPLEEAVELYPVKTSKINLPSVVFRCFEYLEAKGASSEEGIFRLSGSNLTIKALKDRFNHEGDVDFLTEDIYYDVHAVASLLKMYLRELPSSVLGSRELYLQFSSVLDLEDRDSRIAAYNILVHRLPPANWTLIRSLSAFLIGIVNNSNVNKMTIRNVGIVFSPTLNIPSPLFAAFLTDFDRIFTQVPPPAAALSPVMEHPDPDQYRKHVFHGSRPPQSRDGSIRRRSRSRSRSRTPDRSASSQSQYPASTHSKRPSAEELRKQVTNPQYQPRRGGISSREDAQSLSRQSSEDSAHSINLSPPSDMKSKRESMAQGLASTNIMRDAKARRRESSMLLMSGLGGSGAGLGISPQQKSSVPH